ncbi:putative repeat protein (TIGR01451 family), partial [Methanobacterium petrolearium]
YITVTIPQPPVANFTATPTTGDAPLEVQFTDKSTGYVGSYAWDFGDGTNSDEKNPVHTYSTPGSYTVTLTVTNLGGSDEKVKTDYITVNGPDLVILEIKANDGVGGYLFANEANLISVTVQNNGTATSAASTLDVNINGTVYTVDVPALAVGDTATVNVTNPVSRTKGDTVPVSAHTDPSNNIPETNETNNILTTSLTVYNNGYKGKRYTDGDDLETQQVWEGTYDVIYSSGDTGYNGGGWSEQTYTWTSSDLVIPEGATVVSARLYQGYTYNKMEVDPAWTLIFNGNTLIDPATYSDIKGFGSFSYPYGLYVYDVTSFFNTAGNTMTITPEEGQNYGIYGAYIIVVYEDSTTSYKQIYINDGFDMLYSRETYSVSDEEATAYANYEDVDTAKLVNAQVITVLASANEENKSKFFFNDQEYTGFWNDSMSGSGNPDIGFSTYDVTSNIVEGLNIAGMQSYDSTGTGDSNYGDNMYVMGSILVTTLDTNAPTVSADLAEGTYNTTQSVTLSATDDWDPNPVIYYTLDGSDPTTSSSQYTGAIDISSTTTLKFMAVDDTGNTSPIYTRTYTIPNADVYINSWVSNDNPQVGDLITMTFKIGNNGPDTASGVLFTYVIPESFEYVGMIADSEPDPVYDPTTRTVTWNLGDLPVGDPTLNLILKVIGTTVSTSSPTIFSTTYDLILGNNAPQLTVTPHVSSSALTDAATSTTISAVSTSASTVPMEETGAPLFGLIIGVLSILSGLIISKGKNGMKLPLFLLMGVVFSLAICGTVSADPYTGGDPPITVQNGTVSGGLYEDSYYGFTSDTPTDVDYDFQSLPDNAQVVNATLYTAVYIGNMQTDYPTDVNVTFNGQQIASEHLSSTYSWPEGGSEDWGSLEINDHCNRVTSDYFMWYDVTSLVQQNNNAHVVSNPDCFDGRIKLITLIIAYNDGDNDQIMYWVNQGHDTDNYYMEDNLGENYIGQSTFISTLPTSATVEDATLKVIHLASTDSKYTFNENVIANSLPQGSYSGSNTWNVTSYLTNYGTNTLTYDRSSTSSYYKIALGLLSVKYVSGDSRADLFTDSMVVPEISVVDQTYTITTTINNGGLNSANNFQVKLYDNNQEVESQHVNVLAAGSSTSLSFSWKPTTTGSHSLQIIFDPDNQVEESNETNNQISKVLEVELARPDLIPEKLEVPLDLVTNQVYQLNTTIANRGYKDSNSFMVKLYDGDQEIESKTVTGLNIGETIQLLFNWTPTSYGSHNLKIVVDPDNLIDEYKETNNEFKKFVLMKESGVVSVFIISDKPGTNILNMAALDILEDIQGLSIQLRNGLQIEAMTEDEVYEYLRTCDVFIGEWVMTNAEPKLTKILSEHPEITEKGVFLILEPPVSVKAESVELMKYSSINGVKLLENFTTEELLSYYQNTMRGSDYNQSVEYMNTSNFPEIYNKATIYKNLNDNDNLKNQILWALSLLGLDTDYEEPSFSSGKQEYGIYRYQWYTLEDYIATYFSSDRQGCVGLIESTMYVDAQELQPYYAIIEALEARGLNVIPVTAYGGTEEQLKIMLQAFTNATNATSFIENPSEYLTRVDAIVAMPAYGLGGDDFTLTTEFFDALGVPVIRALHSDYVSNEEWYLSTSGLPNISGDKWWHITILEAQGEIEPTFVGGMKVVIDSVTGAAIIGYVPQEDNINSMTDKILGWVQLKYTANALKKVALIYYNYPPGKNNIGASYLDPIQSILNLLNVLKSEGYTVENIPVDTEALEDLMLAQGINVANWAPGEVEKLADNPNVVLYSVDDYMAWFSQLDEMTQLYVTQGPVAYIGELVKKAVQLGYTSDSDYIEDLNEKIDYWLNQIIPLVPEEKTVAATPLLNSIVSSLKKYAESQDVDDYNDYLNYKAQFMALDVEGMSGWGEAPGDIMVVERNGTKYFVLPGIQFGNVFIGPEPQRGWEGDVDQLYHNMAVPPHHQYLAFYAWLQQQGTDAMVYIGRHATHEWLPGKEVILAPTDFPNVVTGSVPQIYFYISDGLAEGIQAKRRGNAVIIDHLIPPMTYTSLYGYLGQLAILADDYDMANSTAKLEILSQIKDIISENDLEIGMGVDISSMSGTEIVEAVNDYISDIQGTLYPYGLHVIGQEWSDDQIALMVSSMLSVGFQIPGGTETTTLQNEIALIFFAKTESSLSAQETDIVQGICEEVVKALIDSDISTVASKFTDNPSDNFILTLEKAKTYINLLNESVYNEVESFLTALSGGYITPGPGDDPISNPDVLPTGRNFYHDQAAEIPTKEAYEYGKTLALLLLEGIDEDTKKVAIGIWCVETARDDGALVSMVLYLLGMKPVWSDSPSAGVDGQKLKEMPEYIELEDLVRPEGWSKKRIDAVIITSGLFRDLYSRQAGLLDKAFRIALARSYYTILADSSLSQYHNQIKIGLDEIMDGIGYYGVGSESLSDNYVAQNWVSDFIYYLGLDMTPEEAGEMAISRIFAPPDGDYGAGISKALEMSWTWDTVDDLAEYYLTRMGHIYSQNNWGTSNPAVFTRALSGVTTMYSSRNTNLYGVLDNDDYVDYWGGLYNTLKYVNKGETITWNVLKYADRENPKSVPIQQVISQEITTRYVNPDYIEGMQNYGYGGGRNFARALDNFFRFSELAPELSTAGEWNKWYNTYFGTSAYSQSLAQFMNTYAPFAAQKMMAKFINAALIGAWNPSKAIMSQLANALAQNVMTNGVSCCDCVCGNLANMKYAMSQMSATLVNQFMNVMYQATGSEMFNTQQQQPSGQSVGSSQAAAQSVGSQTSASAQSQSSGSSGQTGDEESEGETSPGDQGEGKAYEVSKDSSSSSGASESGLPVAAVVGVIALVCLVGLGYFKGNFKGR